MTHMKWNVYKYGSSSCKVLDVGSMNIKHKGTYRILFGDKQDYIGIDLKPGDNVDIVLKDSYMYPFEDDTFDLVLCGQVLEHCENPFKLIEECARVLKPGGFFLGVAPFVWPEHKFPVDCWRILPDGWIALFKYAKLKHVKSYIHRLSGDDSLKDCQDCWGIATKEEII